MKILHVVGARPNFMKIAPIIRAFAKSSGVEQTLVHTGQHYDEELSSSFFDDLELPRPDLDLGVGSGPHGQQTGRVMIAFEPVVARMRPDWVFTVGDVNSTLAAALVGAKLGIPVAHVEAGLRSGDWSMPEEINRVLTDRLSDALFTTEPSANRNLETEGIPSERVHHVGNVMIDTLDRYRTRAAQLASHEALGLRPGGYVLVTLHRPHNVDEPTRLAAVLRAIGAIAYEHDVPVVLPLHPRTARNVRRFGLDEALQPLQVLGPAPYLEFLCLMDNAGVVLTDSGGIQEETSVLGVPCVTLRPNTERPITVEQGTNRLFDGDLNGLPEVVGEALLEDRWPCRPELWDGEAADRIVQLTLASSAVRPDTSASEEGVLAAH